MKIEDIKRVVNEYLIGKEIELVNVFIEEGNVIEVDVDALKGVTIDQCAMISRHIEENFDREKEDYELTVASYSISSPFKTVLQYRKNIGRDVEVKLTDGVIIIAKLMSADESGFTLEYDEKVVVEGKKRKELQHFVNTLSYNDVNIAKLVF